MQALKKCVIAQPKRAFVRSTKVNLATPFHKRRVSFSVYAERKEHNELKESAPVKAPKERKGLPHVDEKGRVKENNSRKRKQGKLGKRTIRVRKRMARYIELESSEAPII